MHLRTQRDVRRFTAVVTLLVLIASLALRLLLLPPDLVERTMLPGAIMALMLTMPIAYYLGHRLRLAQE